MKNGSYPTFFVTVDNIKAQVTTEEYPKGKSSVFSYGNNYDAEEKLFIEVEIHFHNKTGYLNDMEYTVTKTVYGTTYHGSIPFINSEKKFIVYQVSGLFSVY